MDVYCTLATAAIGVVSIVLFFVAFMSRHYLVFKRIGVKALTPWPAVGNFLLVGKIGYLEFHKMMYEKYADEKAYGFFEASRPVMVAKDLDMLQDIMVKNFNCFVDRRTLTPQEPMNHMLLSLKGDHWRQVRNTVSPTFTSRKLKQMCTLVEEKAKTLTSNLRQTCLAGKEIELKHLFSHYAIDVIASTGFGADVDSLNDETCQFAQEAKSLLDIPDIEFVLLLFFPLLTKLKTYFGYGFFAPKTVQYFNSFLDVAIASRCQNGTNGSRPDFVQLVVDGQRKQVADSKTPESNGDQKHKKGLSRLEIQGQAFIFIMAGYETVSNALSFALFTLANHRAICSKVQEELDRVLDGKLPTYDNVQGLTYLDMCLNESMRLYPPATFVDRICNKDCLVQGVKIPKGMTISIPFMAMHHDPKHFPNPEKFDPDRFTPENKAQRHPFAFLPFGQGPRNCIGMRLALMELKIAMAAILQEMTPVACSKTVHPPRLSKVLMKAEDGLWVKFVSRNEE